MPARARPGSIFLAACAVLLGACQQVTQAPPPIGTSASAADVGTLDSCDPASRPPEPVPTPADPVEYAAVVDPVGPEDREYVAFTAASQAELDAEVAQLDAQGEVLSVEASYPVTALVVNPNDDPLFIDQYGLMAAHADFEGAWAAGYDGTDVTIAIVDSGVIATHEDLTGQVNVANGKDFVDGDMDATNDGNGHGTHVAGIAAAADNTLGGIGGAPEATILPVRVLNNAGSGSSTNVAAGIVWAVDNGADIINLSLGGTACAPDIQDAIEAALAAGVVVVAAGGNCGNGGGSCPVENAALYPAAGPATDIIAVGATDSTFQRADFSNWTPRRRFADAWPKVFGYLDLAAPGDWVVSTYKPGPSTYEYLSGTSMATPLVSAAVALLLDKCPALKTDLGAPAKVAAMLQSTAVPVTDLATTSWPDVHTTSVHDLGAGLIKVGAATALDCPA